MAYKYIYFNPLPPHGGRLIVVFQNLLCFLISIHSLRMEGDLNTSVRFERFKFDFNPLPPHGGRPKLAGMVDIVANFNPLPPHGGRRPSACRVTAQKLFQSTPSAWRETRYSRKLFLEIRYFNPLPPHGGRPSHPYTSSFSIYFNPLPPHGGRLKSTTSH